jgi:SNF2 Helicase protein
MPFDLFFSPQGELHVRELASPNSSALDGPAGKRVHAAFSDGLAHGLLHLATTELQSSLVAPFAYARDFARLYLTRLCQTPVDAQSGVIPAIAPPSQSDLAFQVLQAPPMQRGEYLSPEILVSWWEELDTLVRAEIKQHPGGLQSFLSERHPQWRLVGRVTLHLAENKRDPEHPFAFLATYIPKLSAQGRVQHEPLGKALKEYAGAKNRPVLLSLLVPIQRATEHSPLIRELVESGEIYHPLPWTPREAYRFLQDIPVFEESGLIVRVPDWWKSGRPPRPAVNVKIDARKGTTLSVDTLLQFSVDLTLDGEPFTEDEREQLLQSIGGLVALRGKWVEVDQEKLAQALAHWTKVEHETKQNGLSFYEGMRLLAGVPGKQDAATFVNGDRDWIGLTAGNTLEEALSKLRRPESLADSNPPGLHA